MQHQHQHQHEAEGVSRTRFWAGVLVSFAVVIAIGFFWPVEANATPTQTASVTQGCDYGQPSYTCESIGGAGVDTGAQNNGPSEKSIRCSAMLAGGALVGAGQAATAAGATAKTVAHGTGWGGAGGAVGCLTSAW